MLCRRGEYLLRCALRAAWRACVFTRMVSVLVMHAAMNITRNVT